ncbi:RluA family pseudouridine synthase [Candidatus Falkowbacteria bacterium]|nr:MAG: RluA family pseudouridine synthase [Candidatus Falkowbacteria bacterium]
MIKKIFSVKDDSVGKRIDSWLAEQLQQPRNQIRNFLEKNDVLIRGRVVSSHYLVRAGDSISFKLKENPVVEISKEKPDESKKLFSKIKVIAETNDYVVLNKPAGLLMHPASNVNAASLVDWLLQTYPKIRQVGEDPLRPGIMHRLDREVSGLVVVAKNQNSFDDLKHQFKSRLIKKEYTALVHGADMPDEGEINFLIERSTQGYKMAAKPLSQSGKTASTTFTVVQRFHNYTLLSVHIKTGRTHQIRAHFSAYNHPVVGDDLYTGFKLRALNKKLALGRIFLVATNLSFTDLKGKRQDFSIKIPSNLQKFLTTLT